MSHPFGRFSGSRAATTQQFSAVVVQISSLQIRSVTFSTAILVHEPSFLQIAGLRHVRCRVKREKDGVRQSLLYTLFVFQRKSSVQVCFRFYGILFQRRHKTDQRPNAYRYRSSGTEYRGLRLTGSKIVKRHLGMISLLSGKREPGPEGISIGPPAGRFHRCLCLESSSSLFSAYTRDSGLTVDPGSDRNNR